jgi:hypothetical protein
MIYRMMNKDLPIVKVFPAFATPIALLSIKKVSFFNKIIKFKYTII